jgi:hypothetical protein
MREIQATSSRSSAPLNGDGISIDVDYVPPRLLPRVDQKVKAEAKPITSIAALMGFEKTSTRPTG